MSEVSDADGLVCPDCGIGTIEPRKTVDGNEVKEKGRYCPECDTEFDEDTALSKDEIDFPVWIWYESYDDSGGLYRRFLNETGLYEGLVPYQPLKYTVFTVWFKIEEDFTVEGPFAERGDDEPID